MREREDRERWERERRERERGERREEKRGSIPCLSGVLAQALLASGEGAYAGSCSPSEM